MDARNVFTGLDGVVEAGRWVIISAPLAALIATSRTVVSHLVAARRRAGTRRERVLLLVPEDDIDAVRQSRLFSESGPFEVSGQLHDVVTPPMAPAAATFQVREW